MLSRDRRHACGKIRASLWLLRPRDLKFSLMDQGEPRGTRRSAMLYSNYVLHRANMARHPVCDSLGGIATLIGLGLWPFLLARNKKRIIW